MYYLRLTLEVLLFRISSLLHRKYYLKIILVSLAEFICKFQDLGRMTTVSRPVSLENTNHQTVQNMMSWLVPMTSLKLDYLGLSKVLAAKNLEILYTSHRFFSTKVNMIKNLLMKCSSSGQDFIMGSLMTKFCPVMWQVVLSKTHSVWALLLYQ